MENTMQNQNENEVSRKEELRKKSLDMVSEINKVPNFYPESLSQIYTDDRTGEEKTMLRLAYKKAWFKAKFPLGRLVTEYLGYNEEANVVEMKAYAYATNSLDEAPIGEGHVFTLVDEFADNQARAITDAILLAEGSAKSRALYEAGFGLQFYRDAEPEELERQLANAQVEDTSLEEWQAKITEANNNTESFSSTTSLDSKVIEETQPESKRRSAQEIVADNNAKLEHIKGQLIEGAVTPEEVREEYEQAINENKKQAQKKIIKKAVKNGELEFVDFRLEDYATSTPTLTKDGEEMDDAKAFATAITHPLYSGKSVGEIFETKMTLLPRLFQESSDEEEKAAIKYLCQTKTELREFCERNGKDFVLA